LFEGNRYTKAEIDTILKSIVVIVDKQEKVNNHITDGFKATEIKTFGASLNYCDYSFYVPKNESLGIFSDTYFHKKIAIERKNSLEELSAGLTEGRARLENEFMRGFFDGCKMFLMVEDGSYEDIINHNYKTKTKPASYLASILSFQNKYNITIAFIGKEYAYKYIYGTFYYYLKNLLNN
jgi:hypothetical protein